MHVKLGVAIRNFASYKPVIQWNLRIKDTLGAEFVLFLEVVLWWEVRANMQFIPPSRPTIPIAR